MPDVSRRDRNLLARSDRFDQEFYLRQNPDVAAAGIDPVEHYLEWGAGESRRPHPFFDGEWYLRTYPDVAEAGINPLVHYLRWGRREGRRFQKRCVVYTAITRQYDELRAPVFSDPDLDYFVFADGESVQYPPSPWIRLPVLAEQNPNGLGSRYCKTHPGELLPGYEISTWVDGAYELRTVSAEWMEAVGRAGSIAFFAHPWRNCAYEEARAVLGFGHDAPANIEKVVNHLESLGFPRQAGLVEAGFMIRNHSDARIEAVMNDWWDLIVNGSRRDQLSINFVLWKHRVNYVVLPGARGGEWAAWMGHGPIETQPAR